MGKKIARGFGMLTGALVLSALVGWMLTMPKGAIKGVWQTEGFGFLVDVSSFTVDIYDYTEASCTRLMRLPASTALLSAGGFRLSDNQGRLRIDVDGGMDPINTTQAEALPAACTADLSEAELNDPVVNFESFSQTFRDHYSFFDLHDVDWQTQYAAFRPKVTPETSRQELFEIMSDMIAPLNDGHINIIDDTVYFSPGIAVPWVENRRKFGREVVLDKYVDGYVQEKGTVVFHGWLEPGLGYIGIASMGSEDDDPETIKSAIKNAHAALADAKSIVVDIRFNDGGSDTFSIAIAEHFTDSRKLVFTKSTRTHDGYTAPFEVFVEPDTPRFDQPTYLLTSQYTASAAEIFTMTMRELPNVTVVGDRTDGGLSDMLPRILPNGFEYSLSHQRYVAADGGQYEVVGVPPDIFRPFDQASFENGKDTLLEEVIAHAQTGQWTRPDSTDVQPESQPENEAD